jgi:hypothetical protein
MGMRFTLRGPCGCPPAWTVHAAGVRLTIRVLCKRSHTGILRFVLPALRLAAHACMPFASLHLPVLHTCCLARPTCRAAGPYSTYEGSPVSKGVLQPDMWGVKPTDRWDWDTLRRDIAQVCVVVCVEVCVLQCVGVCVLHMCEEAGERALFGGRGAMAAKLGTNLVLCCQVSAGLPDPCITACSLQATLHSIATFHSEPTYPPTFSLLLPLQNGVRNSLLVAPMPTASTSQILGNNECFEPYTSNIYVRRVLSGRLRVGIRAGGQDDECRFGSAGPTCSGTLFGPVPSSCPQAQPLPHQLFRFPPFSLPLQASL